MQTYAYTMNSAVTGSVYNIRLKYKSSGIFTVFNLTEKSSFH